MLDEAHVIANPKAKQSKAVMMLQAERRWAVTGACDTMYDDVTLCDTAYDDVTLIKAERRWAVTGACDTMYDDVTLCIMMWHCV